MATPVIQSNGTGTADATTTVTITKPTGLAVGDLMVALVFAYDGGGTPTIGDKAGWTLGAGSTTSFTAQKMQYKIADSADVSAANFSFITSGSADSIRGIIFRITGHSATAPLGDIDTDSDDGGTIVNFTSTFSPMTTDSLLFISIIASGMTSGSSTIGSYTTSGTNPTWTEQYEDSESTDHTIGVASATAVSNEIITTYQATTSSNSTRAAGIIFSIPADTAITATPSSVSVRAQLSAPSPMAAVTIVPNSVTIKAQIPTQSTKYTDGIWSNPDKSTEPTWINLNK